MASTSLLETRNVQLNTTEKLYDGSQTFAQSGMTTSVQPVAVEESYSQYPTTGGVTPLMHACQQGQDSAVRQILHKDPRIVQIRDRTGKTALHYCAENSSLTCIEQILSAYPALISARDEDGYTPLHLATIAGNRAVARYLVSKGADIHARDNEKHTAVHWATVCGEVEILEYLIDSGANPSTPDIHGAFPIHYASQMCGPNSELGQDAQVGLRILQTLLRKGVDVSVRDHDGRQPMLWAASAEVRPSHVYCPSGSADAIFALINAGADVSADDKDGLTALHCAASRGHLDCLEILITLCNADVDTLDNNGCTPLFYAVTLGHADCTELLLKYGAVPDRQDRKGRTSAHCGAAKGQLETLKLLHKRGADMWKKNIKGDFPLHEACQSGRKDLVMWLLSLLPEAVNAPNNDGRCPLHIAAITDNPEMCKILMDNKATVNPIMRNSRGQLLTPVDAALARGNLKCAKYLQLHGGLPASKLTDKRALQIAMQRALEAGPVIDHTGATPSDMTGDNTEASSPTHAKTPSTLALTHSMITANMVLQNEKNLTSSNTDLRIGIPINSTSQTDVAELHDAETFTSDSYIRNIVEKEEETMKEQTEVLEEEKLSSPEKERDNEVQSSVEEDGEIIGEENQETSKDQENHESSVESTTEANRRVIGSDLDQKVTDSTTEKTDTKKVRKLKAKKDSNKVNSEDKEETKDSEKKSQENSSSSSEHSEDSGSERSKEKSVSEIKQKPKKTKSTAKRKRDTLVKTSETKSSVGENKLSDKERSEAKDKSDSSERSTSESETNKEKSEEDNQEDETKQIKKTDESEQNNEEQDDTQSIRKKSTDEKTEVETTAETKGDEKEIQKQQPDVNKSTTTILTAGEDTTQIKKTVAEVKAKSQSKSNVNKSLVKKANSLDNSDVNSQSSVRKTAFKTKKVYSSSANAEISPRKESENKPAGTVKRSVEKSVSKQTTKGKVGATSVSNDPKSSTTKKMPKQKEKRPVHNKTEPKRTRTKSGESEQSADLLEVPSRELGDGASENGEILATEDVDQASANSGDRNKIQKKQSIKKNAPTSRGSNGTGIVQSKDSEDADVEQASSISSSYSSEGEEDADEDETSVRSQTHYKGKQVSIKPFPKAGIKMRTGAGGVRGGGESSFQSGDERTHELLLNSSAREHNIGLVQDIPARSLSSSPKLSKQAIYPMKRDESSSTDSSEDDDDKEKKDKSKKTKRKMKKSMAKTGQKNGSGQQSEESSDDTKGKQAGKVNGVAPNVNGNATFRKGKSDNVRIVNNANGKTDQLNEEKLKKGNDGKDRKLRRVRATTLQSNANRDKLPGGGGKNEDKKEAGRRVMSGGPRKVESMDKNMKKIRNRPPPTEVSITQAMQTAMRKYSLERRLFQQLLDLKRMQIRNSRANEHMLIKRMVEEYNSEGGTLGLGTYAGAFTFSNYEKYLYDQLRTLQSADGNRMPLFKANDDVEKLTRALRKANVPDLDRPIDELLGRETAREQDINSCNHSTHRCHHAIHAYTGVPCAAYLAQYRRNVKTGKVGTLPQICPPVVQQPDQSEIKSQAGGGINRYDPTKPLRVELQHGNAKQQISLPTNFLDKNRKYQLKVSIQPSNKETGKGVDIKKSDTEATAVKEPASARSVPDTTTTDSLKPSPAPTKEQRSAPPLEGGRKNPETTK